jgi:Tol biopolymer transport system component
MSLRDGNREIYVMDATGENDPIRLTNHPAADKNPTWGP